MAFSVRQLPTRAAGTALLRQFNLKAIEADPNSQFGYIGLAHSYRVDAQFGWHEQEHNRDEALRLAAQLLRCPGPDLGLIVLKARRYATKPR